MEVASGIPGEPLLAIQKLAPSVIGVANPTQVLDDGDKKLAASHACCSRSISQQSLFATRKINLEVQPVSNIDANAKPMQPVEPAKNHNMLSILSFESKLDDPGYGTCCTTVYCLCTYSILAPAVRCHSTKNQGDFIDQNVLKFPVCPL